MRAVLLLLFATTAYADLPTIESEHPPRLRVWSDGLERVSVDVHGAPEATWVQIAIGGRERAAQFSIDVPAGTRVIGLGVAGPHGAAWGRPAELDVARQRASVKGAAIVRWNGTSADQDHLVLGFDAPATIDLALHLPPLAELEVDTNAGVVVVEVEGEKRVVAKKGQRKAIVELADLPGTIGPSRQPHVGEDVAFFAAASPAADFLPNGPESSRFGPRVVATIDKAIIRRYVKRHYPQLRQCFMAVAQWNPSVKSGGAILSFVIMGSGAVATASTVESDLPDAVNQCLRTEVIRWEFPSAEGMIVVNYPVTFRLIE